MSGKNWNDDDLDKSLDDLEKDLLNEKDYFDDDVEDFELEEDLDISLDELEVKTNSIRDMEISQEDFKDLEKASIDENNEKIVNDIDELIERERKNAIEEYKEQIRKEKEIERILKEDEEARELELEKIVEENSSRLNDSERPRKVVKKVRRVVEEEYEDSDYEEDNSKNDNSDLTSKKPAKKKSYKWLLIVALLGVFVLGVTFGINKAIDKLSELPLVTNNEDEKEDDTKKDEEVVKEPSEDKEEDKSVDVDGSGGQIIKDTINKSSVYESDLENGANVIFKMGMISEEGLSIPVTYVISKEKLIQDFGTSEVSQYDMYMRYGTSLNEEGLGYVDYHPYKGILSVDEESKVLTFRFDEESISLYDSGTASTEIFKNSLIDTFGSSYGSIKFENSSGDYYLFSHEGEGSEKLNLNLGSEGKGHAYYKYDLNNGNSYIGTNFGTTYDNVTDALLIMKVTPNDLYDSLIPKGIDFTVDDKGKQVIITFKEELDLSSYSNKEVLGLIEGLNLTVTDFNKTLKLENIKQSVWQDIDLTTELPNVLGANKVLLN